MANGLSCDWWANAYAAFCCSSLFFLRVAAALCAAVRWALSGKHSGWGMFGAPSGADVYVWGVSHAEFGPWGANGWGIRREYVIFDEVMIWKQIHLHTGAL